MLTIGLHCLTVNFSLKVKVSENDTSTDSQAQNGRVLRSGTPDNATDRDEETEDPGNENDLTFWPLALGDAPTLPPVRFRF